MRFFLNVLLAGFLVGCGQSGKQQDTESAGVPKIINKSLTVELEKVWETDTIQLKTPECVTYDGDQNVLYVSNLNRDNEVEGDGYISVVNIDGSMKNEKWVQGLTAPLGNDLYDGYLFVNDKMNILKININNGIIEDKIRVEGASGLNGMDIDVDGNIYVADSGGNKVYKITQDKEISVVYEGEQLNRPNGVFVKNENELLVASSGGNSLKSINMKTDQIVTLVEGIGQADGIIELDRGHYLTSSWTGEVYFIRNNMEKQKILDTRAQEINAADIGYIPHEKILVVPTFYDNRLVAYKLKFQAIEK